LPDEWQRNTGGIIGEGVLHNSDVWNYSDLPSSAKQEFLWNSGGTTLDKYDTEIDLFQFNLLGMSGRFILVKESGAVKAKLLTRNQNIKIEVDYNTSTLALNSFIITDTKGYIYTFDIIETTDSEPFIAIEYFDGNQSYSGQGDDYVSRSAWHLSKIEMPNSTSSSPLVLVDFDYVTDGESYTASVSRQESRVLNPPMPLWNDMMAVPYNASITQPKSIYSYYTIASSSKKLFRVNFNDGTKVELHNLLNNHPETNGAVLDEIRIFGKNSSTTPNKIYEFTYDYLINYVVQL
jgi:hypothetical protein